MPNQFDERFGGPIRGLRLPLTVWNVLSDEGITSIEQLRAVANQLEKLPRIGVKLAQMTREELARLSGQEKEPPVRA